MSTDDVTHLDDAVYLNTQLAFHDIQTSVEVHGQRIYLYIGPVCLCLSVADAEKATDLLDGAIQNIRSAGESLYGPVRSFSVVDAVKNTLKLVKE